MPIFAALASFADDVGMLTQRLMGKRSSSEALPYENPNQLVAALRDPWSESGAVARMKKLGYGAFYKHHAPKRPFGPITSSRNVLMQREMFSGMAERELLLKGKGFGGAVFGRPVKGFGIGMTHLKGAIMFAPLTGILGSYVAPKGHKLSSFVGGTASSIAFGIGDLIGSTLGGPLAGFALGFATEGIGAVLGEGLQDFSQYSHMLRHVNMGGNYEDTKVAYTMRQRAALEMGSSVMNARKYLGSEAILMHQ